MDSRLGKQGRDKITGFEGIITSRVEYLTGCNQLGITPKVDKEGKVLPTDYFDEHRIEVVGEGISLSEIKDEKDPGGPNRDSPKH